MKKLAIILLIALGLGCKKEAADPQTPSSGKKLVSITVNGKVNHSFQYDKNLLIKENYFGFCETNPTDEFNYEYKNAKLSGLKTTLRSMYSSSSASCDPAAGLKGEEIFEYNTQGKIVKATRNNGGFSSFNTTTEYVYNAKGFVEKQIILGGTNSLVTTFEYDATGNLIKQTDPDGQVTNYEYDNKINPYYLMNQRPAWISPFNKSPNNVIKASNRYIFKRTFKYDEEGYPTEVSEDNGFTYKYNYEN
ncbi:RHS repeat domain-containing protein [Emticicia sp. C21]|uniref:RHS repeat domain-containing protein n=1 Tax=Emticicia sp. C21 TaxID=2302915 RepID=UPI000E355A82|nr:RHS repeat domain-containing protein [Emticicia sp. C21]RFS17816.1 hypothetical protein D0T08_00785 [Emticicia sp. C21]